MSTTSLIASEVMDRAAALMNDTAKQEYTYAIQLPYLNMAIDELIESLEESNSSPTNNTSAIIILPLGSYRITPLESMILPHYPSDLIEIQEVAERLSGSEDVFVPLTRREFFTDFPANNSLLVWRWENQIIKFNANGALTAREIQLKYVGGMALAVDSASVIGLINARSYLSFKTAAFLSFFIGENETRSGVLNEQAEEALSRMTGMNNKGRQEMVTRHRPFRASYKARGGMV